jgi:hypothetical protein
MSKISELGAAGALAGTEEFPVVQSGSTVKATVQDVADLAAPDLNDLGDVNAPTPSEDDVLTWDAVAGEWKAEPVAAGVSDLDDLGDVDTAGGSTGDVLTQQGDGSFALQAPATVDTSTVAVSAQTGTYTLVLADAGKVVRVDSATAADVTVPPNSSVAFTVGTVVNVRAVGAGQVTVVAGSGVTVNTAETLVLSGQWSEVSLHKVGTDEWDLVGDVEASP